MTRQILLALGIAGALFCGTAVARVPVSDLATSPARPITRIAAPALLDINSATRPELTALKGVGDKRADDIVKGRPYKGKDDLVAKKILPQGVYDGIKDKIVAKQK